jgi:hypothetical protein
MMTCCFLMKNSRLKMNLMMKMSGKVLNNFLPKRNQRKMNVRELNNCFQKMKMMMKMMKIGPEHCMYSFLRRNVKALPEHYTSEVATVGV